jgi:hypothetical protein
MTTVTILGAGGKMGFRIATNLADSGYNLHHVEVSEAGRKRLDDAGIRCTSAEEALPRSDVVVLAVPDHLIGKVAHQYSAMLKAGTMLIALDAAAPYAGHMPARPDLVYFVTHPCHPPIFNDETDPAAQADHFGGVKAKQHIVCALMQGPEQAFALGEAIARRLWRPVMRSHRITVEQLAILEPVLSETVGATCVSVIREAMEEAIRLGVPPQAAQDFIEGHLTVEIAILFGHIPGAQFSDGAKKAIEKAKTMLFKPDWKKVFEKKSIDESIRMIVD